jgi:hypothetical protein
MIRRFESLRNHHVEVPCIEQCFEREVKDGFSQGNELDSTMLIDQQQVKN